MNKEVLKTIKILTKLRKQYNVSTFSSKDINTLSDIDKKITRWFYEFKKYVRINIIVYQ